VTRTDLIPNQRLPSTVGRCGRCADHWPDDTAAALTVVQWEPDFERSSPSPWGLTVWERRVNSPVRVVLEPRIHRVVRRPRDAADRATRHWSEPGSTAGWAMPTRGDVSFPLVPG
jgi:hypothetical protein